MTLNLQENYLDGTIPAACGELRQLQKLNLGSNRLHGFLPDEMEQMEELGVLDVIRTHSYRTYSLFCHDAVGFIP